MTNSFIYILFRYSGPVTAAFCWPIGSDDVRPADGCPCQDLETITRRVVHDERHLAGRPVHGSIYYLSVTEIRVRVV